MTSRLAEMEVQLKASIDQVDRLKKEVVERTKSKQQLGYASLLLVKLNKRKQTKFES